MSLPRKNYSGQTARITIVELRAAPGDVFDRVAHGMEVQITKNGVHVATIVPPEVTVIKRDGSFIGRAPLTKQVPA